MEQNFNIKSIKAKQILDSQDRPTIEVELKTDFGKFKSSVPAGISTGKYEAIAVGIPKAIENVEKIICPVLAGKDLSVQEEVDEILINLDGTENKSRLGANAILAVSIAVCRAGAKSKKIPLYQYIQEISNLEQEIGKFPLPSFNIIEGGKHARTGPAFQEFMVIPQKESFKENLETGKKIYKKTKRMLKKRYGKNRAKLSAEGAFSEPIREVSEAIELVLHAAEFSGERDNIKIAIDAAASEIYESGIYTIDGRKFSAAELTEFYKELIAKYPIVSIEDPFEEEDFDSWKMLKSEILIFGDDLTVSNIKRVKLAKEKDSCSGLILKPNQIGTVSETIKVAKLARSFGWKIMVANRAGETNDDFIADLAVGLGADFIKSGAPFPKERMVKYNRLIKIEKELNKK